ncbi:hypothetical protein [Gemmatimonas sp.]|uniref:hypothetical protein n=1 Tax=Gemmatimonas sp. TaxID=1962908 RepID=UPI003DA5588A
MVDASRVRGGRGGTDGGGRGRCGADPLCPGRRRGPAPSVKLFPLGGERLDSVFGGLRLLQRRVGLAEERDDVLLELVAYVPGDRLLRVG